MSAYAHHPSLNHQTYHQDCSALDLLSRVALEQYPEQYPSTPPSHQQSQPYKTPPTTKPFQQLSNCQYPQQYRKRHIYTSDFSPVSSDDGSSHTPQPFQKFMKVSKEHTSVKSRTQPSRFCHICSRTSKKVGLVACGNFATGACRKVVCQKCFNNHNWDWEDALSKKGKWICTHCRQECPQRAQCAIYKRTNERRREQQQGVGVRCDTGTIRGGQGRFVNKK